MISPVGPGKAIGIAMDVTSEEQVNTGIAKAVSEMGGVDILISNAGIQIVHPVEDFPLPNGRSSSPSISTGRSSPPRRACRICTSEKSGSIIFMGSVHSKEASPLKSAYVTAKHGLIGLARAISKEGGPHGVRANVICPGFVRTPLVEKQIPEQARALGISEEEVVKKIMLGDTVDGEFTTVEDVAQVALLFASFPTNALTGQSLVVSHGWYMN